ncbi:winged helix-turn-helix transcriptional regulator [Streptomyces iranensis]|uniref:DNA-binding HxlR family transcriptional regulator n=1 Tax=Streptomyces iranensis TaxID=576784 RepID=A0A060ZHI8_9ACTN|nr:helix-turn-helix domain-containing protein [Streptomyces iranensis]MBP2061263.1 DNA-binding HxlR family transcriptional regulator [Streptomyces iranensis]CDR05458.1 transcriptional regulator, HxlR family [Streptomyces iranensis]
MANPPRTEWDPYAGGCPSREVLDRIGDKWTVLVLGELAESGTRRYTALRRKLDGVSEKMLTQTLRALERDGLVRRTVHPEIPPRVEYEITELGATLREPLVALKELVDASHGRGAGGAGRLRPGEGRRRTRLSRGRRHGPARSYAVFMCAGTARSAR